MPFVVGLSLRNDDKREALDRPDDRGTRKYNDTGAKNTVKTRLDPKTRSNERKTAWTSMTCYDPTDV